MVQTNTKKTINFGLLVFIGEKKIIFMLSLQQNLKNAPDKIPEMLVIANKIPTKWRF